MPSARHRLLGGPRSERKAVVAQRLRVEFGPSDQDETVLLGADDDGVIIWVNPMRLWTDRDRRVFNEAIRWAMGDPE